MIPRLEVNNLSVSFDTAAGRLRAVRGIGFSLAPGETLALVGESGSGKTVTCRSLMRLLPESAVIEGGEIRFEGRDILGLNKRELRELRGRDIAMIFQDPMTSLDPTMRVGNQIGEALRQHSPLSRKAARERVVELLDMVGIENPRRRARQYPHEFSGGQRQRIVIAGVLACKPKVLIADEPTTALDVTMQAQIIELLKGLQRKMGTSVIFITHDLGVVAKVADRVAVMYAGKIVETGLSEEIFYDPRHPYTWGLLNSLPALEDPAPDPAIPDQRAPAARRLHTIPGSPPSLVNLPPGDPFAPRNPYALEIDFLQEPPLFPVSDTHYAATWLLDPRSPRTGPPPSLEKRRREYLNGVLTKEIKLDNI
jgi:oligopeptide transport system ATP-binding protein